jgi:hypothetical protein
MTKTEVCRALNDISERKSLSTINAVRSPQVFSCARKTNVICVFVYENIRLRAEYSAVTDQLQLNNNIVVRKIQSKINTKINFVVTFIVICDYLIKKRKDFISTSSHEFICLSGYY